MRMFSYDLLNRHPLLRNWFLEHAWYLYFSVEGSKHIVLYFFAPLSSAWVSLFMSIPEDISYFNCFETRALTRYFTVWLVCFAAHLNHFMEIYSKQNYNIIRASMVIGMPKVYSVIKSLLHCVFIEDSEISRLYRLFTLHNTLYLQVSSFATQ